MKKKIVILGSTGSIGKSLLKIVSQDINKFEVVLLTANKNYRRLLKQAKKFKVKNVILTNLKSYKTSRSLFIKNKIKIFNNFKNLNKILNKKVDYSMSSIIGLEGLYPTIKLIKHTKKIAIANKEAIICGWNIIKKNLIKNKTEFIPVDSEHFSIWKSLKYNVPTDIKEIILTASGGPFLNTPLTRRHHLLKRRLFWMPDQLFRDESSINTHNDIHDSLLQHRDTQKNGRLTQKVCPPLAHDQAKETAVKMAGESIPRQVP